MRRTPLYERHAAAGAKLVPFAGWEMPVQYAGIREEHMAVRTRRRRVRRLAHGPGGDARAPDAPTFLQRLVSNDVRRLPEGGAQYSLLCRDDGGVLDDLFTYRLAECHFLTVTNAANHENDLAWLQAHAGEFDVDVIDRAGRLRDARRPGPAARELVQSADRREPAVAHALLPALDRRRADAGVRHRLHGRGRRRAAARPGARRGGVGRDRRGGRHAGGLGARDTLRLEVCFHLYGNDLSEDRGPIEAGLGWCCREATGFIGVRGDRGRAQRRARPEKLVPFAIEGTGIARQGNPVLGGGVVTSGTFSPCLERGIGMAYVSSGRAEAGTQIEIDVRGTIRPAVIERKPLYRKGP